MELIQIMKGEFSDQYSYSQFGFGSKETIIVSKSCLIGAQITIRENEIMVDSTYPFLTSIFSSLVLFPLGLGVAPNWRNFEKSIVAFLRKKYT